MAAIKRDQSFIFVTHIGTCEYPFSLGSSLYILDYNEPAIVGTTVSINCLHPGEVLVGPNTATCMDNGQWVPDPNQLQMNCKGIHKKKTVCALVYRQYIIMHSFYAHTLYSIMWHP